MKDTLGVFESRFVELVRSVARRRRSVYIDTLARRLLSIGSSGSRSVVTKVEPWTPVPSLSALRAIVGGRFANLKEKWLAVGFPLREGRDEGGKVKINRPAWLELANWIEGQGYSARLPEDGSVGALLEVRAFLGNGDRVN